MARLSALIALTAAAVAVSAKPILVRDSPVTVPIARRFNSTGVRNVLKADQARAQALKARSQASKKHLGAINKVFTDVDVPVTNVAEIYTASVGVGTPPTTYNLIIDTGSSNTWVGASTAYVQTSSSVDTGDEVEVSYGSGFFFGEEYTDTVTIGDLVIKNQGVGAALFSEGFDGVDGILGIGPADLTQGTTSSGDTIPTVLDTAFAAGTIDANLIGISFEPTTEASVTNGELSFGAVDDSKHTGDIAFVPITSTSPASEYVGIDQSITYGSAGTTILSSTAGITDTGTTLVLLASDALAKYQSATGAVADNSTGLLKITQAQFDKLESLFFHIGDNTYEFTPNAQIWPRSLNSAIGGDANSIYLVTADLGSNSGQGLDFIDGYTFLERFYYVYDVANAQVGFATTQFTNATTN
ncbi:acid protease [Dichomitus squalens]|uniref:Acid protease n=2 Tax=Dichomitus squalens TaxID=114155 RepID=A0A4Q9P4Z0_9APHY|nr:acid protease [Dichomitus squalens LYAD-421 SS1]EJF58305.1 acid protease [Dichomitus squalens LYAD-421 SS1]TBU21511.1 acid protease [Dichomitus squalens]TBU47741.1 acid protease [Dichomitus squalens]